MADQPRSAIVTLLFTDIVNSTELLQKLGEDKAQRAFEAHHKALREAVFANNGQELEWLGDGIFAEFPSAADAVRCAIAIQRSTKRSLQGQRLQIRVGVSGGEVFRGESGYFGETIVVARRLCDTAEAGQVLCSGVIAGFLAVANSTSKASTSPRRSGKSSLHQLLPLRRPHSSWCSRSLTPGRDRSPEGLDRPPSR